MTAVSRYAQAVAADIAYQSCKRAAHLVHATWPDGSDMDEIAGRLDQVTETLDQIVVALRADIGYQREYRALPNMLGEQRERERERRETHRGLWVKPLEPPAVWMPTAQPNTTLLPTAHPTITLEPVTDDDPPPIPELMTWRERRRWRKGGGR